jgi:tyrosine-protein kinase Etk/Wzc
MAGAAVLPATGLSQLLLRLAAYRLWLLMVTLLSALLAGLYSKSQPETFTAYARLLPPQTNASSATALLNQVGGNAAVLGASALTLKNPSDLYASLFLSRTVQDSVIESFALAKHYAIADRDDLRVAVLKRTRVDVGKDGVINLSYTDSQPARAADITNALIEAMYQVARRLAREDTRRRMQFYDGLIEEAAAQLQAADAHLLKLEQTTGLTRLKGQEEAIATTLSQVRSQIISREVELERAKAMLTAQHPEMQRMEKELFGLRTQLARLESRSVHKPNGAPQSLLLPMNDYAEVRSQVEPARRKVEYFSNVLADLIKAREFSRGDETRDLSVMQVLDYAVAPSKKSGPRVVVNAVVGAVLGFLLALLLVLVWELLFTDAARRTRWRHVLLSFFGWRRKLRLKQH